MLLNWAHLLGIWEWTMFYSWFASESWELLTLEAYEPGRDWSLRGREAEVEGRIVRKRALFPARGPQAAEGTVYLERVESELVDF